MTENGDSRINDFRTYAQQKYKLKYGVKPSWKGREYKLTQDLLKYFDENFPEEAAWKLQEAYSAYLKDSDNYIEKNGHKLTSFAANPEKWCKAARPVRVVPPEPAPPSFLEIQSKWEGISAEALVEKVLVAAEKNPVTFFRGFVWTQKYLRLAAGEEKWKAVSVALADLVGRNRARTLWTKPELVKPLP